MVKEALPKVKKATAKEVDKHKPPAPIGRKIAILGTTPTRMQAPLAEDSGWEIWTIGPGGKDNNRWDRLYEIHGIWPEGFKDYLNDLRAVEPPQQVWTMNDLGEAKSAFTYPKQEILDKFTRHMWFSSSISWCIAHALYESDQNPENPVTDMGCWGIDLESGEEYISQFVGAAHLIDLAIDRGIRFHFPQGCGLERDFRCYPDRFETNFALTAEKKADWLQGMVNQVEAEFDLQKINVNRMEGQLMLQHEWLNNHKDKTIGEVITTETIQQMEAQLQQANQHIGRLAANVNQLRGELEATQFYRRMFVWNLSDPEHLSAK